MASAREGVVEFFGGAPPTTASHRLPPQLDRERLLFTFLENAPLITWVIDRAGRFLFVSPQVEAQFGVAPDSLLGRRWDEVFPGATEAIHANIEAVRRTGRSMQTVEAMPDLSGQPRHWLVARFLLPGDGYVGGASLDITDQREAELARRETEATFRQVLDALSDMVLVKGPQSRLEWANKAFRDAYGMTNEQLAGLVDAPFVAPDYTQQYVKDDQYVFTTGRTLDIPEEPVTCHDGRVITVHTVKSPIFDSGGNVIKTVGVSRDVTERKKLEMDLRQAQKLESVGRLAAGVAHEINTPIQFIGDQAHFIRGSVDALVQLCRRYQDFVAAAARGAPGPDAFAAVAAAEAEADLEFVLESLPAAFDAIGEGVGRVSRLVKAMKEFGHPDRGEREPADINRILENTLTIAGNELKGVADVETHLGELPAVPCHAGELGQVFLNLVVNAAHAIADKVKGTDARGRITVSTRLDGDHVVVDIADTGVGIPATLRDRIFDPFFTTKEVGRGTGQGLAIARRVVVDKHHGTLAFDSVAGQGTTFHVRIPAA